MAFLWTSICNERRDPTCWPAPGTREWYILRVFIFLPRSWGAVGSCKCNLACVWFWSLSCLTLGQDGTFDPPAGSFQLQTPSVPPSPPPCILCKHFLGPPETYT